MPDEISPVEETTVLEVVTPETMSRQARAVQMRIAGLNFRDIADRLGYAGPAGAYKAVKAEMKRRPPEPADEVREIELARLDRAQMALWKIITGKDATPDNVVPAVNSLIRLSKRRSDILGLDAPKKIDITARIRQMAIEEGLDPDQAIKDALEMATALEAMGSDGGEGWRA